jgi:hypothetical protein
MKGRDALKKGSTLINFSCENKPFALKDYNFKKRALTSNGGIFLYLTTGACTIQLLTVVIFSVL